MKLARIAALARWPPFAIIATRETCRGDVIAAACTQIGATVRPDLNERVWLAAPHIAGHYDEGNGVAIEGGLIRRPTGPGLGVQPDDGHFGAPVLSVRDLEVGSHPGTDGLKSTYNVVLGPVRHAAEPP